MAVSKLMLTEFGIHHRLESCVRLLYVSKRQDTYLKKGENYIFFKQFKKIILNPKNMLVFSKKSSKLLKTCTKN